MKIVITGASSGLGAALARAYARTGHELFLAGRDAVRLSLVALECQKADATVHTQVVDVTDRAAMASWLASIGDVDLLIANAGISAGTGEFGETEAQARRIFAVNLEGVLNTLHPVIPCMVARGKGQIALISSLAGLRGQPGAPAYSASKGAVRMYGESLRLDLAAKGVGVTVVCPGFVRTPMTDVNKFPMPWRMEADAAARLIARKLAKNPARIAFPWQLYALVWLLAVLPVSWADHILAKLPKKGADAVAK